MNNNSFDLELGDDQVVISLGETLIGDFAKDDYLRCLEEPPEDYFLPPGVRWIGATREVLVLEEAPRWRTIHFNPHMANSGYSPTVYRVPFPFLLYGISLVPNAARIVSLHWAFQPISGLASVCHPAPLPNIYTDEMQSGVICTAHQDAAATGRSENFSQLPIATKIAHVLDDFWASEFNMDITYCAELPFFWYLTTEEHNEPESFLAFFSQWEHMSMADMMYPHWPIHSGYITFNTLIGNLKSYTDTEVPIPANRAILKLLEHLVTNPRIQLTDQR